MQFKSASCCLAVMALLIIGSSLEAQDQDRRQGRGNRGAGQQRISRALLLRAEAVQDELDISEDQLSDLNEMRGRRGGGDRGADRGGERGADRGGDRGADRGGDRGADRGGDRGADRGGDRGADRGGDRGADRGGDRGADRGGDRGGSRDSSLERVQAELNQLGEVLDENQIDRLNEIYVQVAGISVLQDPLVAKQLSISEEQVEKMQQLRDEMRSELREMARDTEREEMREKFKEMNEVLGEKMMGILTDSQQKFLDAMKGKPFDLPEDAKPLRRGRGRDRGGEGRGDGGRGDGGRGDGGRGDGGRGDGDRAGEGRGDGN